MGKSFSCDLPNCNFVCAKQSDLKKHIVGHKDPSKLHRCDECFFTTLDRRNLEEHKNTHSNARPHKCDQIVDGKPCDFSSNGVSALCKHRRVKHQITGSGHKGKRKARAVSSQVDTEAGASHEHTFPATPSTSFPQTHPSESTPADVSDATSTPASTEHPVPNNHPSAPGTYHGQGWYRAYDLTANSAGTSSLAGPGSQNSLSSAVPMSSPVFQYSTNNTVHVSNAVTYPPPIFPTSPGPILSFNNNSYSASSYNAPPTFNSFSNYTPPVRGEASNNRADTLAQGSGSANVMPGLSSQFNFFGRPNVPATTLPLLHNSASALSRNSYFSRATRIHSGSLYSSVLASRLRTESTRSTSSSVTPCLTEDASLSPGSCMDLESLSPSTKPAPCDQNACAEPVTPHDDGSTVNRFASTLAVEPVDAALDTPDDSSASRDDVTLPAPPSICVPPVPQEVLGVNNGAVGLNMPPPSKSLLEELCEDETFYRGAGRNGYLFPEMMANGGIEGWDKSHLG